MIKSFSDKEREQFYVTGKSRKIPSTIHKVALRKLDYLKSAFELDYLLFPPANRLEKLSGDLKGFYSIRINKTV
jgi:Plasmid maintenance system killer protein